jgi:hypothetical protein
MKSSRQRWRTCASATPIAVLLCTLLGACGNEVDTLSDGRSSTLGTDKTPDPAGSGDSMSQHTNDPGAAAPGAAYQPPEPTVKVVGSPEVTARLHGCGKLSLGALGSLLASRGLAGGSKPPQTSGKALYAQPATAAAFGAANYTARVPEAPFASTSAMAKMFDIFTMASYDAVAPDWSAPACPDAKVLGGDGKFTSDGLSCLMGKPATAEHLAIANTAIEKSPTDGTKLVIAALLSAAHTCQ